MREAISSEDSPKHVVVEYSFQVKDIYISGVKYIFDMSFSLLSYQTNRAKKKKKKNLETVEGTTRSKYLVEKVGNEGTGTGAVCVDGPVLVIFPIPRAETGRNTTHFELLNHPFLLQHNIVEKQTNPEKGLRLRLVVEEKQNRLH